MASSAYPSFPALPDTQCLSSATFIRPPLSERTLTLPQLYDWNAEHSPEHTLFTYHTGQAQVDVVETPTLKTISWRDAGRGMHRASWFVHSQLKFHGIENAAPVIGILAATDAITYLSTIMGILRAGLAVFPISPRNSPASVAHLMEATGVSLLLIGEEPKFRTLANESFKLMTEKDVMMLPTSYMPHFSQLFPKDQEDEFVAFPYPDFQMKDLALIQHSSGSTTFPKSIYWSHGALLETGTVPYYGDIDLCGVVFGIHAVPMFHGLGSTMAILAATVGLTLAVFPPQSPATIPTAENVFDGLIKTKSELAVSVPTFIEQWAKDQTKIEWLKKYRGVLYGGGPLNKAVGDTLAEQGVNIYVTYASTEGGVLSAYVRKDPRMDWEYFRFSGHTRPILLPYGETEEGEAVEVVLKAHEGHSPRVLNLSVESNEPNAYATNDLVIRHPQDSTLFKVYARKDDQIMLSTGEKTNPSPIETTLSQDGHIQAAVVFGRGRFHNGVVILPAEDVKCYPGGGCNFEDFIRMIRPTLEKVNALAPQHSRIFPEMVIVANPEKPFTFTAKGTPRRQAVIIDYEAEIEQLYKSTASTEIIQPPSSWDSQSTREFVHKVVCRVMKADVQDDLDLFSVGCDSLQATWIRNSLSNSLKNTARFPQEKQLPDDVVYRNPTISNLAKYISEFGSLTVLSDIETKDVESQMKLAEIQSMLEKYTSTFQTLSQGDIKENTSSTKFRRMSLSVTIAGHKRTLTIGSFPPISPPNVSPNEKFSESGHEVDAGFDKKKNRKARWLGFMSSIVPNFPRQKPHLPPQSQPSYQHSKALINAPEPKGKPVLKHRRHRASTYVDNVNVETKEFMQNTNPSKRHAKHASLSSIFPPWGQTASVVASPSIGTDVVVVTGTTGGLGSNLLYRLALEPAVQKVYALNRIQSTDGETLQVRQENALRWVKSLPGGGIDILSLPKVVLLECDFQDSKLGLRLDVWEDIRASVTHIIHNAWRVDFNLKVSSFESNIIGLQNLVNLALDSPLESLPRLLFVSSISIFAHPPSGVDQLKEEEIVSPQVAMGTGYSESKWIGERILSAASRNTPLRPIIVRVGQVSGNAAGYWNEREWLPSLVKSGVSLRCLPDVDADIDWIPAFTAARVLVEMRNSPQPVLHLVHPRPVSWTSLMTPIAKALDVQLVKYTDWLAALENTLPQDSINIPELMQSNPALRLLSFFREAEEDQKLLGVQCLSIDEALKESPTLGMNTRPLSAADALGWVQGWKDSNFI